MSDGSLVEYGKLLGLVKQRIHQGQLKVALSANAELICLYWDIGRIIDERQKQEGWGSGIIPRLAKDVRNELPEVKGFSERNIKRMLRFYREYSWMEFPADIVPQPAAQTMGGAGAGAKVPQPAALSEVSTEPPVFGQLVCSIPWFHHVVLMEKVKDLAERRWYILQAAGNGWSRDTLVSMIRNDAYARQGSAITNFEQRLSSPQSGLATQLLKDPYVFDFMTLEEPFRERELETGLVRHLEKFLLELGQGFAFVGRQYPLVVSDKDYFLDLLFYHYHLHCFVVVDLKRGEFKPEYAGKMNFYCSVVDDQLRSDGDQPTIGLILCQTKDRLVAEYALRDVNKPIGISDYELTRALPENLKSSLPSIEEIEAEFSKETE